MIRRLARSAVLIWLVAASIVSAAPAALADAAGPTDYRTDIVSIEPGNAAIHVEMIGGDAFLSLTQLEPVEVIVLGYQAEPYLRFDPDGTVYENRRSPAVWLNQERYGNEEPPAFARADARPEWFEVAANGTYSWHDHRSHWMNPSPPPSSEAGDQVLEATVPILVNDEQVVITVASFLLEKPSLLPAFAGAAVGLAAAVFAWRSERLSRALIALLIGGLGTLLGAVAYLSVPVETQPSPLLWVLPAVAMIAALVFVLMRNHTATTVYLDGLIVTAGATLGAWGFTRADALRRAIIPTDAPFTLDRIAIALAFIAGAALLLQGFWGLMNPRRLLPAEANS